MALGEVIKSTISGIFPPMDGENTRNAADMEAHVFRRLDHLQSRCSLAPVVEALTNWAKTNSLIRYPSPFGRSWSWVDRPPLFSADGLVSLLFRQAVAHQGLAGADHFDLQQRIELSMPIGIKKTKRGEQLCDVECRFSRAFWPLAGWQPVVTHLVSRPLSAGLPVPGQRRFWTATFLQVQPLVRQAMSPIASFLRTIATKLSDPCQGAMRPNRFQAIGAGSAGGLFCAVPTWQNPGSRIEKRDQICSRRS